MNLASCGPTLDNRMTFCEIFSYLWYIPQSCKCLSPRTPVTKREKEIESRNPSSYIKVPRTPNPQFHLWRVTSSGQLPSPLWPGDIGKTRPRVLDRAYFVAPSPLDEMLNFVDWFFSRLLAFLITYLVTLYRGSRLWMVRLVLRLF